MNATQEQSSATQMWGRAMCKMYLIILLLVWDTINWIAELGCVPINLSEPVKEWMDIDRYFK